MTQQRYMRRGLDFAVGKAVEEMGELNAAIGKTLRWGWKSFNPELPVDLQESNADWVRREMHDVRGALDNLENEMGFGPSGIYVASKTKHAAMWRGFRLKGYPIISTWIDEAGAGESADLNDLWVRCIRESATAKAFVLFREGDDVLKGGWIELGAALAKNVPVFAVGIRQFTVANDRRITHCNTPQEALSLAIDAAERG